MNEVEMRFLNKNAIITGAARGIGRATAIRMAKEGAKLALLDVNEEKLCRVKEELAQYTDQVLVYGCDVSCEARVKEVMKDILEHFGQIHILVNNAGIFSEFKPFLEVSHETWLRYLNVNVMGAVNCTRAVIENMLEHHYGRIINVASVAGVYGIANYVHYSASKGAIIAMTKALAKEVTEQGILVNSVSPGTVSAGNDGDDDFVKTNASFLGRTGTLNENANLICFLASDESGYISGQNIQIDGLRRRM